VKTFVDLKAHQVCSGAPFAGHCTGPLLLLIIKIVIIIIFFIVVAFFRPGQLYRIELTDLKTRVAIRTEDDLAKLWRLVKKNLALTFKTLGSFNSHYGSIHDSDLLAPLNRAFVADKVRLSIPNGKIPYIGAMTVCPLGQMT
jgi:hypothetical protein